LNGWRGSGRRNGSSSQDQPSTGRRSSSLSQLPRHGRQEKASTIDQIERFTGDVETAKAKIARCGDEIRELSSRREQRADWDAEHGWPDERLRSVDRNWPYCPVEETKTSSPAAGHTGWSATTARSMD
jgi:hypothetical protein